MPITSKTRLGFAGGRGVMAVGNLTVFGCFYINPQLLELGNRMRLLS